MRDAPARSRLPARRTTLAAVALVALALLAWRLADVLLLAFSAVLVATALRSLAGLIERHTPLKPRLSLLLAGLVLGGIVVGFVVLLGAQVQSQLAGLADRLPGVVTRLGERAGVEELWDGLAQGVRTSLARRGGVGGIVGFASGLVGAVLGLVLVLVAGVYLAVDPGKYRDGLLGLVPRRFRREAGRGLETAACALRLWLAGQLLTMAIVGTITTVGLSLIGVPSALALGLIAGIAEFVPYIGPILAAIPAVLVAVPEGGTTAFWVVGLYLAVQQLEGNVLTPLVQQRMVDVPPFVMLFAILAFSALLGPMGTLLGAPLTILLVVFVRQFYVQDVLGEDAELPCEE